MKSSSFDMESYGYVKATVRIECVFSDEPRMAHVWLSPIGATTIKENPDHVFTKEQCMGICRVEECYGIPNAVKRAVPVVFGTSSVIRNPDDLPLI